MAIAPRARSDTGYIINIPIAFDGDLDKLDRNIRSALTHIDPIQNHNCRLVIGLNQVSNLHSPLSEGDKQRAVEKTQAAIQDILPRLSPHQVAIANFSWTPVKNGSVNYVDIRNRLYNLRENDAFFQEFQADKQITSVFYTTVDPDTILTDDHFTRVEELERHPKAPLLIGGVYEFKIDSDIDLIDEGGHLHWEGFLAKRESHYDALLKKDITAQQFTYVKYPYQALTTKTSLEEVLSNQLALEKLQKHHSPPDPKSKLLKELELLYEDLSNPKNNASTKKLLIQKIQAIESDVGGIDFLNRKKTVLGSSILYPPEPLLFINLLKRVRGLDGSITAECNFKQMLDAESESLDSEGLTQRKIWGSEGVSGEGPRLLENVRRIWRDYKKDPSLHPSFRDRNYIDLTLEYKTLAPERVLTIPEGRMPLPTTISELRQALSTEKGVAQLRRALINNCSFKPQSSLGESFQRTREGFINSDQRFGGITAPLIDVEFGNYFSTQRDVIFDTLMQEILEELHAQIA